MSFLILGAISFVAMTGQAVLLETAAGQMTNHFKYVWFQALLRQDMAYFDLQDVSGTATIIATNGAKFRKGVGRKLAEGVQFMVTFVGGLGFGFYSSWVVSLVVLAVLPFVALSATFLVKMNQTQTARANSSYSKAGSIVYTAVSSIRTILSLNAVEQMIDKFFDATQEAYEGATNQVVLVGLANGAVMACFMLAYIPVTLYGSYLLYDNVRKTGCDPSGGVMFNEKCVPAAKGVFGALFGLTFAAMVVPQVSTTIEAFTDARSAAYPALLAINRKSTDDHDDGDGDENLKDEMNYDETDKKEEKPLPNGDANEKAEKTVLRRGTTGPLPKYVIDTSSPKGLQPDNVQGTIQFNNVRFCYPTRQEVNVFDGFDLTIPAGKTVALVGPRYDYVVRPPIISREAWQFAMLIVCHLPLTVEVASRPRCN